MTNLTTYPLEDWFETTLAQSWNGWTGTVYLNTAPSFTFPSGVKTYIVVNPWKTNMQVGRIDSINVGNKTVNVDSITIEKGAGVNYSAQIHAVGSKVIISDNYQFWKDIATAINSKADSASPVFTGSVTVPEYVDATARDAAIPTPTDWMIVQTGGIYQWYNAGTAQWESFDIGTPPPNASTTVKWLVQEATDAQVGASTATWSTGAKLFINPTSVVKTSSGAADENKLVALNAQGQVAAGFINNAAVLAEWVEALVDKDTFFLWEDADAGDSVFVEDMVTFASADQVQAIGDTADNTRVSIPAFWTWVAANTLKLALRKYVSPWVDLWVRIETDNAGDPSGTLFDADATSTVTAASLTTSLVDTTVTLADTITIPLWQKVWIVLFAGTYGAETINATNYFGVWYKLQDTTTRRYEKYDWVNRALVANNSETNTHWVSLNTTQATTAKRGFRFEITRPWTITTATKNATANPTTAYITDLAGNILSTATFATNTVTFNKKLDIGTYFLLADTGGASYNSRVNGSGTTFPKNWTYCNITAGTNDWWLRVSTTSLRTFESISFDANLANNYMYVDSDLFTEKLLSLTDSTYTYKLPSDTPRVLTESKSAGQYAISTTLGFNNIFVGLTELTKYYISQTPWAISSTATNNWYIIWEAIDATTLNVVRKYGISTIPTLNVHNDTPNTTVTSSSYLATFDAEFGFIFDLNVGGASSATTGTIQYSLDNSNWFTMQTESIGAGASRSYRVVPVITGRYYRVSTNHNANATSGTSKVTLEMIRPL